MTKPADWSAAAAASDRALPAGTRIDDYEVEQTLAEGGVAIVYRAFDHALGLQVALEEYMPEAMALRSADGRVVLRTRAQGHAFEEGRQAFIGEARTLARFEHPALLRIDRVLQRNGTVYRAMRLHAGPTLLEHRRALAAPPDAATLQRWLEDLLGALAALHAEGCVHGALAPERIRLREGGHLLLLGFDAVRTRLISGRTQEMMAALEPCFAAPEQRRPSPGQADGPWSDLCALATTLRYCIDGELPPPAAGLAAARPAGRVSDAWRRVRNATAAATDAAWLRAIDACLAEAPQDRPQSVAQLRRMIDEALFASTVPAWPAPRIASAPSNPADAVPGFEDGDAAAPAASAEPGFAAPAQPESAAAAEPEHASPAKPAPAAGAGPRPAPGVESVSTDAPVATDAAIADMLADLDQTLARVTAMASEDAALERATCAPDSEPTVAPIPAPAPPPVPWRRELRALWQRSPAAWLAAAVVAAATVGLLLVPDRRSPAGPASNDAAPAAPTAMPPPPPVRLPPPAATTGAPRDAVGKPLPAPLAAAMGVAPAPPAAPQAGAKPPAVPAARPQPAPRAGCSGKSGYALLQCMQAQCAKRSYAQHPQCVRLRRDQSLG